MKLKELYRNEHIIVYTDKDWDGVYFWNMDLDRFVEPSVDDFIKSKDVPRMLSRKRIKNYFNNLKKSTRFNEYRSEMIGSFRNYVSDENEYRLDCLSAWNEFNDMAEHIAYQDAMNQLSESEEDYIY